MKKQTEKKTQEVSNLPTTLKWISGGCEAFLGIPLLGAMVVMGLWYIPLLLMLAFHIVNYNISKKHNKKTKGNILGIITSCVAWIPFVGMVMHIVSASFLMIEAYNKE